MSRWFRQFENTCQAYSNRAVFGVIIVAFFGIVSSARAELIVSPLFGENACLQAEKPIVIWGKADPGAQVEVAMDGQVSSTVAEDNGRWMARLPAMKSGGPFSIKISSGDDQIISSNVVIGEVWLAAGQSNMMFELERTVGAREALEKAHRPDVRLFQLEITPTYQAMDFPAGSWKVCSPETAGKFSGVAYYFGVALNERLQVPVGLIQSAFGGTPIEGWLPTSVWESSADMKRIFQEQEARGDEHMQKRYARVHAAWKRKGSPPASEPPVPDFSQPDRNDPSVCFNSGIAPLLPFSLAGFLWYQGEWNVSRPLEYPMLQRLLIDQWRACWQDDSLAFFFVQLPSRGENFAAEFEPDSSWAAFREAQEMAANHPGAGMAVTIDVGGSLHPERKREVGDRLARLALKNVYGVSLMPCGPLVDHVERRGSVMAVRFTHAEGLELRPTGHESFYLRGSEEKFYPAQAKVIGNEIHLTSEHVPEPMEVRYLWANNPEASLFNQEGLPARPFRRSLSAE